MTETTVRAAGKQAAPTTHEHEMPHVDRWMKVMYSAFIPAIAAVYSPDGFKPVLFAVTGVLFVAGLVMMLKGKKRA